LVFILEILLLWKWWIFKWHNWTRETANWGLNDSFGYAVVIGHGGEESLSDIVSWKIIKCIQKESKN
jgi:hypothetical protein